jgi:hypothetical protein
MVIPTRECSEAREPALSEVEGNLLLIAGRSPRTEFPGKGTISVVPPAVENMPAL